MRDNITQGMYDAMQRMKNAGYPVAEIGRVLGVHHTAVVYNLSGRRKTKPRQDDAKTIEILSGVIEECIERQNKLQSILSNARATTSFLPITTT